MRKEQKSLHIYDVWGNVITDNEKSFCHERYEVPFALNHVLYRGYYYDGSYTDTESDTNEKIDSFMGKGISFLGIDVIFDGEESVLKNANLKNVLNNNILCSNTKIARNIINIYSDNVDYPEKYFDMWRVYLLK